MTPVRPHDDWPREFYDLRYAALVEPVLTTERTHAEVDRLLAWAPAARTYLDLGCGSGRHVLEVARRGLSARGVDQSAELVAQGRAAAEQEGLDAAFVVGDYRDVAGLSPADLVACLFNSWGLGRREDDEAALARWLDLARDTFVLELWHRTFFAGAFEPTGIRRVSDELTVHEDRELLDGGATMEIRYRYETPSGSSEAYGRFRLFDPEEVETLLERHPRVREVRFFGSLFGDPLREDSRHLVAVASVAARGARQPS